jgi:hypothetical protein
VFDGSASALVAHLLDRSSPSREELDAIRSLIEAAQAAQEGGGAMSPGEQKGGGC